MIITYLIKSTLCLAVLFGFYKIALEAKALHHFKRYYLLASLIFSLTIPLVTFTYTTTETPQEVWIGEFAQTWDQATAPIQPIVLEEEKTNYLPYILWTVYGIGTFIFGGRFLLNLLRLKRKITTAETLDRRDFTLALLQQSIIPHSFLKYIFLSRKRYENKEIPPEVIAHEATHVRQKHSLDILFIEFLQVIFWFNPLFWITKKSITLNHEFLADQGAIQEQHNIYQYQHILLNYAGSTHHTTLESPFNYSSTKKRILMLSQSFNKKRLLISALLLIPIIAGCILVFNQGIIAQPNNDLAIEGHWIDHANENRDVFIYEENDTLWWDQKVTKAPIIEKDGSYFLAPDYVAGDKTWELSVAKNGFLKLGEDVYFTPPEDTVSYRIDGIWITPDGETKYRFITKNGGPTCDVINVSQNKSTRYYPKLVDNGMTFTIGNEWHTFTFDNGKLTMQDGAELKRIENYSVYKTQTTDNDIEHLTIKILDDTNYMINDRPATNASLKSVLESFNTNWSKEERQQVINATISEPKSEQQDQVTMLHEVLYEYGVKEVQVYMGLIFPNTTSTNSLKEKHPTEQDLKRWLDTNQYGVWINNVKVRNEVLTAYKPDDLPYFTESTLEKNDVNYGKYNVQVNLMSKTYWREKGGFPEGYEEYLEMVSQQKSQNYATEYVEGAERNGEKAFVIEIKKNTVRVNGKPSSVATLRRDIDAITRDWEETDYTEAFPSILVKNPDKGFIKKLNEEFLKTNFSKANGGMDLVPPPPPPPPAPEAPGAQLPPPPPPPSVEEHLKGMNEIGGIFYYEGKEVTFEKAIRLVKANKDLNVQTRHPYTNKPKTYISKEPIVVDVKEQSKDPVTKEDIKVYNKLAKKYGKNPNGKILKSEIAFMYEIYNRMTKTQKENAEPYPALPPPPPPAPVKVKKGSSKSNKSLPPPPPPPSPEDHIRQMARIDGTFYYEKEEVTKEKAIQLIQTKKGLNMNTPYPYTNPPKTYLTHAPIVTGKEMQQAKEIPLPKGQKVSQNFINAIKNHQDKKGVFILNGQKASYAKIIDFTKKHVQSAFTIDTRKSPIEMEITSNVFGVYPQQQPVTDKELKKYNSLAKKYAKNPKGKILQKEVALMYSIYNRMTPKQKKNAESYPALPPPPPPAPKKSGTPAPAPTPAPKKSNKLASSQEILGLQTIQEQTKAHLDRGGIFKLNGKTVSKKEILELYTSGEEKFTRVRIDKKEKPPVMYVDNIAKEMVYSTITQKEIEEYNKLAKKYNSNANEKVKKQDVRKLYHVYVNMTKEQRAIAEPYPTLPSPPKKKSKREPLIGVKGKPLSTKRQPLIGVKGNSSKDTGYNPNNTTDTDLLTNQNLIQLPKPTRLNILTHLRTMNRHEATFIFKEKEISFTEVMKLARNDRTLDVTSYIDKDHKKTTTYLTEKGWKAVFDEEHALFRQEKVTIAYQGKNITEREAKELIFTKPKTVELKILSKTKEGISVELVDI